MASEITSLSQNSAVPFHCTHSSAGYKPQIALLPKILTTYRNAPQTERYPNLRLTLPGAHTKLR